MRLRPNLIIPPKYRSEYAADRKVTWLELFYDLVFVVVIAELATYLYSNFTGSGVAGFILLAVPCWWGWVGQTLYLSRFDSNDLVHQLLTMLKMFFVMIMALALPSAFAGTGPQFAIAYGCIRLILVYEYFRAGKHNPPTRPLTTRYAIGFLIAAILWLASAGLSGQAQIIVWVIAVVVDLATPSTAGVWNTWIPPHLRHLPERMGLFTIIILGESIVGIVLGLDASKLSVLSILCAVGGWILVFCIWFVYFIGVESAEEREIDEGAAGRSFRIWFYGHLPMMIGVVLTAMGVKASITYGLKPLSTGPALGLCLGCGLVMVMLQLLFTTNSSHHFTREERRFVRHHAMLNAIPFLAALLTPVLPAVSVVWLLAGTGIGHFILAHRANPEPMDSGCSLAMDE